MPCSYVIDTGKRLVITTACGCVTFAEIRAHQDKLLSDPEFNPEFNQLIDATAVTELDTSVDEIRIVVNRKLFSATSRRGLVASQPAIFGIGRMMATYLELSPVASEAGVFRDLASALRWLGDRTSQ